MRDLRQIGRGFSKRSGEDGAIPSVYSRDCVEMGELSASGQPRLLLREWGDLLVEHHFQRIGAIGEGEDPRNHEALLEHIYKGACGVLRRRVVENVEKSNSAGSCVPCVQKASPRARTRGESAGRTGKPPRGGTTQKNEPHGDRVARGGSSRSQKRTKQATVAEESSDGMTPLRVKQVLRRPHYVSASELLVSGETFAW